jgi:adenosylhomocysteine nucleosidase
MQIRSLILLPIDLELKAFVAALQKLGHAWQSVTIGRVEMHYFPRLKMACGKGGLGKTQFAIRAQHLLENIKHCDQIFLVGAAGSLKPAMKVADLVVATSTVEHDFTARFIPGPQPEFPGTPELLARARIYQAKDFTVHFDKVASGDEDVVHPERAAEILKRTDAAAVAWEGAGLCRVARFNEISHLEVRSISDLSNANTPEDFKTNLSQCMEHSALIVEHLLNLN